MNKGTEAGFSSEVAPSWVHRHPKVQSCLDADFAARKILDAFLMPELWETMRRETNRYM